ncbi:hypothetical protein BJ875DRAFT_490719 [Amylocarpus encephaloides]|uniref:Uncharacterized protein n=1 Tax=Amylocarpus encephaloides TaxID=45428 RepID=A0A9P7Y6L3_9HELO|nr:hypothetical protein BJ875DRAFT_490719 [Amylocarpus encephaloides]
MAWRIVTSDEIRPHGNNSIALYFDRRLQLTINLIYSSVPLNLSNVMRDAMTVQDPAAMWTALQVYNKSNDLLYTNNLREQFNALKFNPANQSIRQVTDDLEMLQLEGSILAIPDQFLASRLLAALLQDNGVWTQI